MAESGALSRSHILLVDDYACTGASLSDVLALVLDCRVTVASGPAGAIGAAAREPFDLAIVDLRLPDMDGIELFTRLRTIQPHLRGLLVSAYATEPSVVGAGAAGFDCVLEKPVDIETLVCQIGRTLSAPP
jgi:CheY-like chemotaxis protein